MLNIRPTVAVLLAAVLAAGFAAVYRPRAQLTSIPLLGALDLPRRVVLLMAVVASTALVAVAILVLGLVVQFLLGGGA